MLKTKYWTKWYSKWHHCASISLFIGRKNSISHRPYVLNLNSCRFRWDLPLTPIRPRNYDCKLSVIFSYQKRFAERDPSLNNFRGLWFTTFFPYSPSTSKVGLLLLIINQYKSWSIPSVYQSTVFLHFRGQTSELTWFFFIVRGNIFFLFCFQLLPGKPDAVE